MIISEKERLQVLRENAGLTQGELADKVGVSVSTINDYESNVNNLRETEYETLETIANALNVQVDHIFLG